MGNLDLSRCWHFAAALPALAAFPEHPITLVVPFSAGGPTDTVARDLGRRAAEAARRLWRC